MSCGHGRNQVAERQLGHEWIGLLRAFHHAHGVVRRWQAARLAGTVVVALAAPVVINLVPPLEHPLGAL
jgi:predicted pore-forming effector associated with SMODS systems